MVKYLFILYFISRSFLFGQVQPTFNQFFVDKTLRIDFIFNSSCNSDDIRSDNFYKYEKYYANRNHLLDEVNMGKYFLKIYDAESKELIYSRGFTGLVSEYKITEPALNGTVKEFQQTLLVPFPKKEIIIEINGRTRGNNLKQIFSSTFDPDSQQLTSKNYDGVVDYGAVDDNGCPLNNVDLLFIGEGYGSKSVFMDDVDRYKNALYRQEPFHSNKDKINIRYAYAVPSSTNENVMLEGTNIKTVANTNFNTLGMNGYLGTEDIQSLYDIACGVPCDHIIVLVKSERFGGNGIYNHFCMTTTDHKNSEKIFLHEFGHSFGGLADEYYEDFYSGLQAEYYFPPDAEPLEANITINADAGTIKWKDLLTEGIDVPTKWNKTVLDSMQIHLIKRQIEMEEELQKDSGKGIDNGTIGEKRSSMFTMLKGEADLFKKLYAEERVKYENVIGAFEGAAHFVNGFYRPGFICIMNKTGYYKFCAVCQSSFQKMIDYYCE